MLISPHLFVLDSDEQAGIFRWILALSKRNARERKRTWDSEDQVRNGWQFLPVITALQKPGLRGKHTMTPLCQKEKGGLICVKRKKKKDCQRLGDEIWEKRKVALREKYMATCSLFLPLLHVWGFFEVKKWTNSGSGHDSLLLLATDATPAGYSKQSRWVQHTNGLLRPDLNTVQIYKSTNKQQGGISEEEMDFYWVTWENICKLLTGPRHQEKRKTYKQCVWL